MIYSSHYFEPKTKGMYRVRISKTQPKGSYVEHYSKLLEPSGDILWGYKKGMVSQTEYTNRYLNYLDEHKNLVLKELDNINHMASRSGKDAVLLCWCRRGNFCHRRILAKWYKDQTGIEIKEL